MFEETSAAQRIASVPLAHLSIEVGHLYFEDFQDGPDRLVQMFRDVAPWARAAREICAEAVAPQRPRISTCYLVDDYFSAFSSPAEVLPMLLDAAAAAGVEIDYIAREASCVRAGTVPLAELVAGRLVADPPPETTGNRPMVHETGWLCNGVRTPQRPLDEAMQPTLPWQPPSENAANRHSIFIDVELWNEPKGERQWSCPFLAAVWQLLRLGTLRMLGESVVSPCPLTGSFPQRWVDLPPVIQLRYDADPFSAYRTFSVLANRFLPIEHAVRTILSQVAIEPAVTTEVGKRAKAERLWLPGEVVDRIEYAFAGTPWRKPAYPAPAEKGSAAVHSAL